MLRRLRLMKSTKGRISGWRRGRFLELLQRRLQFEAGAVQQPVGAADVQDLLRREAAALQAHRIDAVRLGRLPHRHDIGRHVAGHRRVVAR